MASRCTWRTSVSRAVRRATSSWPAARRRCSRRRCRAWRRPWRPTWTPASPASALSPDDLDAPAPVGLAVELDEEHALPGSELQLAVTHGHRLASGAEQHGHAVRVAVPLIHVLGTDV